MEVIRSAVNRQAKLVQKSKHWQPERVDQQLTLLALSGYRLMDPRHRDDGFERVQLTYPMERMEEEVPQLERLALLVPAEPMIEREPGRVHVDLVELVDQAVDSIPAQTVVIEEDTMESRRALVRLLQEEREQEREGWMSVFGRWVGRGTSGLVLLVSVIAIWRLLPTSRVTTAEVPPINPTTEIHS